MFATGKSDFDPSGLRATMSTNWEATEASLDANMPDHVSFIVGQVGGGGKERCY